MRKILYISGTRADYGLMRQTLFCIIRHPGLEIEMIVTGMHLMADSRMGDVPADLALEGTVECIFEPVLLRPRQYSAFVSVCGPDFRVAYDRWGNAAMFAVSAQGLEDDVTFIHGQSDLVALPYTIRHEPGGIG